MAQPDNTNAFRKYVVEFVGTFFLLMSFCMATSGGLGQFAPLAIGATLMVMVYAGGHISGAHFNPAVSLACYLRGKLKAGDLLPFIVAQCLGGVLAVMLSGFFLESIGTAAPAPKELNIVPALIAEVLGTIAVVYVYLNVYTAQRTAGNSYYGLAIGFVLMACLYVFGNISGGAFNPAIALGMTMADYTSWSSIWVFLVANFGGGALAAFLFQYVNGPEV
ncbi:MAG: aquaporin [Bacteroidota bacterium]|nr:aquaporin [Bacteroidota bacterium]